MRAWEDVRKTIRIRGDIHKKLCCLRAREIEETLKTVTYTDVVNECLREYFKLKGDRP